MSMVCLIAAQRSGSTALRSVLEETGEFRDFGEVFDPNRVGEPGNFLAYCEQVGVGIRELYDRARLHDLFVAYTQYLKVLAGTCGALIDVKFDSWGHFSGPWIYPHQEPLFMTVLRDIQAHFLFLKRLDIAAQAISHELSCVLGKWHNIRGDDLPSPIVLDTTAIVTRAIWIRKSEELFSGFLSRYAKCIRVNYEDIFDETGCLTASAGERLRHLVSEKIDVKVKPRFGRSGIEKSRFVVNFAKIEQAVWCRLECLPHS